MPGIREINDIDELGTLRADWSRLLSQTPSASFFHSLEWLEVYWRHYGRDQKLRVIVAADHQGVFGILPLVVRSERTKAGQIRFLTYPLDYWGSFYGPIGPRPAQTLAAGLAHVTRARRGWDVLELRWVGWDDVDRRCVEEALSASGCRAHRTRLDATAVIDLAGSWEDYLAAKSRKWRHNLARWQRKLNQLGDLTYLRYRPRGDACGDADPRWDLYRDCLEIARASWQGSSSTGTTLSHDTVAAFLGDVHAAAARFGSLDVSLLYLDRRPLAFAYNYHYQGYVFGLRIGFDASVSRDGVGNVLNALAIEDSFRRGDRLYDLGPGSLACKRRFQTALHPIFRYSYFPPLCVRALPLRLKRYLDSRAAGEVPIITSAVESVVHKNVQPAKK
ncbi:MAG: GNAT family N-acetyltransferase [Pirellulales bacterium]|nr:GNAT family N-acetyltransferase [Pirellulales bacterium]